MTLVYFCHVFFGGRAHTTAALPNQTYPGINKPLATSGNGGVLVGTVTLVLVSLKECVHIIFPDSVYRRARVQGSPIRGDASYVGRSAPEIDSFEATVDGGIGKVCIIAYLV